MEFELKVITPEKKNKVVTWDGKDGVDAANRYADCFHGHTVVSWRAISHGLFIGGIQNIIDS